MQGKLIIVGASARAAAHSAARSAFAPVAIDLFADADLAALCPTTRIARYPADFPRALAQAPDAPWMFTGGLENHPRLVGKMAVTRSLLGNSPATLRAVRDPGRLSQTLLAAGLRVPALWSGSDAAANRWLVKPRRGSAGLGVRFAEPGELLHGPRHAYLQEYIDGESCSATYVTAGGGAVLLGVTRQLVGRDWGVSPEFLYLGSIGPLEVDTDERRLLNGIGNVLAREFDLVGLVGVDFIRSSRGIFPVEVNPRYTASIEVLERVTGLPFVASHVAACRRGELPIHSPATSGYAGKAVVYARQSCRWIGSAAGQPAAIWPEMADIPHSDAHFERGQPIVTVLAAGESVGDVHSELRRREQDVLARLVAPVST